MRGPEGGSLGPELRSGQPVQAQHLRPGIRQERSGQGKGRRRRKFRRKIAKVESGLGYMETADKSIAVGYSGGLDSTLIAFMMGRRYSGGQVRLMTAQHGFGHLFSSLPLRHVRDLKRFLGEDRVFHSYARIKDEFRKIVLEGCLETYEKFGRSNFFVCLGCSMAMDVHMISLCLEHMVPVSFWGYTPRGSDFVAMSLPETSRERRALYGRYGILYRVPLIEMHMEKPEERAIYKKFGIWPGLRFRKIAMGVQPPCLWGITMHHLDIMFEIHPQPDRKRALAFMRDRMPMAEELIRRRLEARGIYDIEDRVRRLREMNDSEWNIYGPDAPMIDDMEERRIMAGLAGIPEIALKSFPNSVPLVDHDSLSRDGRLLRAQGA